MRSLIKKEIQDMHDEICCHMDKLHSNKVFIYPFNDESIEFKKKLDKIFNVNANFICDEEKDFKTSASNIVLFDEIVSHKDKSEFTIFLSNSDNDLWCIDFWKFENAGIPCENIINFKQFDYYCNLINNKIDYMEEHIKSLSLLSNDDKKTSSAYKTLDSLDKCGNVYNLLYDEISKKVYLRLIAKKIMRCKFYFDIYSPDQYFVDSIINLSPNEVFVDAGAYDGDTINKFIKLCKNKYKHIYAFEPDNSAFKNLVINAQSYDNISFVNAGLHNEAETVKFENAIFGSSHIKSNDSNNCMQFVDKLFIKGDVLNLTPTFIKMDIEGSELAALNGFSNTIESFKPSLAICIYHKPEDIWEIPLCINNMNNNYKIFIRHHTYSDTETVCYAVN